MAVGSPLSLVAWTVNRVAVFVAMPDFLREADQHPGLGLFVFLVPLLQLLEPVAQLRDGSGQAPWTRVPAPPGGQPVLRPATCVPHV